MKASSSIAALACASVLVLTGCADVLNTGNADDGKSPAGASSTGNFVPRPSPAFESEWPVSISREELVETALYRLFSDLDSIRNDDCSLKYESFYGDPMLEEHHYLVDSVAEGMISSYCSYMTNDIQVIAGNYDFVKRVVSEQGFESDKFGGVCGYDLKEDHAMACIWHNLAWVGISMGSKRQGEPFIEDRRLTIAAHEIFHIVHEQIDPYSSVSKGTCDRDDAAPETNGDRCFRPTWFVEGAGEFFGRAMTQYLGLQNYATFVPNDRSGLFMDAEYLSDLGIQSIRGNVAGGVEAYYSGAIATEYLIANIGLINYLDIWKQMGQGASFFDALENAAGIGTPEFYQKFRDLHLGLYQAGGYCESKVGCSEWTKSDQIPEIPGLTGLVDHTGSGAQLSRKSDGIQGSNDPSTCSDGTWWIVCMNVDYKLPTKPENSRHNFPTDYEKIPKVKSCGELSEIGWASEGWAASFDAKDKAGVKGATISTQIYAVLSDLDLNLDGVVCSREVPD